MSDPIVTKVEELPGIMEPDTAVVTLRNGKVVHVGDDGLIVFQSAEAFETDRGEASINF